MKLQETVKEKWETAKPLLKGFVAGLIVGPIIILWAGWVVTSNNVQGRVDAALLNLEASICAARARAEVKDTAKLEWSARTKLAAKWATIPGHKAESAGYDVTNACAEKLSKAPEGVPS